MRGSEAGRAQGRCGRGCTDEYSHFVVGPMGGQLPGKRQDSSKTKRSKRSQQTIALEISRKI